MQTVTQCKCPACKDIHAIYSRRDTGNPSTDNWEITEHIYCRRCGFSLLEDVTPQNDRREVHLCYTED